MKKLACVLVAGAVSFPAFAQEAKKAEKAFINEIKTDKKAPAMKTQEAKKAEKAFINEQKVTAKK